MYVNYIPKIILIHKRSYTGQIQREFNLITIRDTVNYQQALYNSLCGGFSAEPKSYLCPGSSFSTDKRLLILFIGSPSI